MNWYQPKHFAIDETAALLALMRAHPFATLVSAADADLGITHLPLIAEEAADGICLLGHVAKANEHWKAWQANAPVTALFHGPNAYVAPAWYSTRAAVPTWNYVAVHVHGRIHVSHESAEKERILKALIDRHDPAYRVQWDELGEEFREKMKLGIVGLSITVERIEGKFKLSQNRPKEDQAAVRRAHESGDANGRLLADWMKRLGIGEAQQMRQA